MFGVGKKKSQTYEIDSHETGQRVIVVASSEKDAYKNLPEELREEVRHGKTQLRRVV
jgi:hypothetical protein